MLFHIGDRVECYYGDAWYPGVVKSVNNNGTYFVAFDDGDELADAIEDEIRSESKFSVISPSDITGAPSSSSGAQKAKDDIRSYTEILSAFMPQDLSPHKAKGSANRPAVDRAIVLSNIEAFILPKHDDRYFIKRNRVPDETEKPLHRLEHVLTQAAMMEHVRTMQTLYRDAEDELHLEQELRADNPGAKLPTAILMERLCEKRSRILALVRLCHGDDSLAMIRAHMDLANSYALQGLWAQADDQISACEAKMLSVAAMRQRYLRDIAETQYLAFTTAKLVERVFRLLRQACATNTGRVNVSICESLSLEMEKVVRAGGDAVIADVSNKLRQESLELVTRLRSFISREVQPPSWGRVVDFMRSPHGCGVFVKWCSDLSDWLLPQNVAAIFAAFQLADQFNKGVAPPRTLAACLCRCPTTVRIVGTPDVVTHLRGVDIEVSLNIDSSSGQVDESGAKQVVYELPLTWDELLAQYVIKKGLSDEFELLRVQFAALQGICFMFTEKLAAAEQRMQEAIQGISRLSLADSTSACELYNSIAQLMIMKHREWHAAQKDRCRAEAQRWMTTPEAQQELEREVHSLMKATEEQTAPPRPSLRDRAIRQVTQTLTHEQATARAKLVLLRARARHLARAESDPTLPSVEAAYRYLTKSFDILSKVHGTSHPALAAAALAVASVQNMVDSLPGAEQWLRRALGIMNHVSPLPVRAISFARVQLSQVLERLDRRVDAHRVLDLAFRFHYDRAKEGLLSREQGGRDRKAASVSKSPIWSVLGTSKAVTARYTQAEILKALPLTSRDTLHEDITTALALSSRLSDLLVHMQGQRQAAEQAEQGTELAESSFGWDSPEAVRCRREVGMRCAAAGDWQRAVTNFTRSLEGHELLYGKSDARVAEVRELLEQALEQRVVGAG